MFMVTLPVPDDIAALPDLTGSGTVYDLQQAMVRDSSGGLEALVKQFAVENDPHVRTDLLNQILFQWTGSENIDPNSRGGSIDARKLGVLEAFMGEQWSSTGAYQGNYSDPNPGAAVILNAMYMVVKIAVTKLFFAVVILAFLAEFKENHAGQSAFFAREKWTLQGAYQVVWGLIGLICFVRHHPGSYWGSRRHYQDPIPGQTSSK